MSTSEIKQSKTITDNKNNVINLVPYISIRKFTKPPSRKEITEMERKILETEICYLGFSLIVSSDLDLSEVEQSIEFKALIKDLEKISNIKAAPKNEQAVKRFIDIAKSKLSAADLNGDGKVDHHDFLLVFTKEDNILTLNKH